MSEKSTSAKKPKTITISGIPEPLLLKIKQIGEEEHRNTSKQIVVFLEEAVARRGAKPVAQPA